MIVRENSLVTGYGISETSVNAWREGDKKVIGMDEVQVAGGNIKRRGEKEFIYWRLYAFTIMLGVSVKISVFS